MCGKAYNTELAKNEMGCIILCKACMRYSVTYTNTSFCFTKEELVKFKTALFNFQERDFCYNIMGQSRAILQSQYTNMGFSVSRYDIKVLNSLLEEALVLSEVYEVLG
ncbi:MAG: hypothetical protein JKY48_05355 [Flavobacteriales bacterium]|nr:hypothetical protein [Flavobacteriales bacterium]